LGSFLKTRADIQESKLQAGEKPTKEGWAEPDSEQGLLHTEKDGKVIKEKIRRYQEIIMRIMMGCTKR